MLVSTGKEDSIASHTYPKSVDVPWPSGVADRKYSSPGSSSIVPILIGSPKGTVNWKATTRAGLYMFIHGTIGTNI